MSESEDKMSHNNIEDNIEDNIDAATRTRVEAESKKFSYREALIKDGISVENVDRLLANRKINDLPNTQRAYNKLKRALEEVCNARGVTYNEAIEFACKRGWGFIDPSWNLEGLTAKVKRSRRTMSIDEFIQMESGKR